MSPALCEERIQGIGRALVPDSERSPRISRSAEFKVDSMVGVPPVEDLFPTGASQGGRRTQPNADEPLCGLLHERDVVELSWRVGVGDPFEECIHALSEVRVLRVLVGMSCSRSARG